LRNNSLLTSDGAMHEPGGTRRQEQEVEGAKDQRVPRLSCLLCGGLRYYPIFNEFGIDIMRCRRCHHVFSSFPANPHYDGFWGDEVADGDQFYWSKARARMHQDFAERFLAGRSGRLLDMGCGLGFFLTVVSRYPNWEAFGCEISAPAVQYARTRLGLHKVMCTRLEDADFPSGSLDFITMWDVIDHILEPDPLLRRCHALLREGGICFIRTPNLSTQLLRARLKRRLRGMQPTLAYLMPRDHLHIYSAASIRRLLERNGFSCIEFVHLHPIQGMSASGPLARVVKNVCFEVVRALAIISMGAFNYDTLFVLARKDPQNITPRLADAPPVPSMHDCSPSPGSNPRPAICATGLPYGRNSKTHG